MLKILGWVKKDPKELYSPYIIVRSNLTQWGKIFSLFLVQIIVVTKKFRSAPALDLVGVEHRIYLHAANAQCHIRIPFIPFSILSSLILQCQHFILSLILVIFFLSYFQLVTESVTKVAFGYSKTILLKGKVSQDFRPVVLIGLYPCDQLKTIHKISLSEQSLTTWTWTRCRCSRWPCGHMTALSLIVLTRCLCGRYDVMLTQFVNFLLLKTRILSKCFGPLES